MDLDEPNRLLNSNFLDENIVNYPPTISKVVNEGVISNYKVELTTKRAVELLLEGTLRSKVCRYCLCVASPLSDLDQIMQIAGMGTLYKVSIRDMVACFHPFKVLNDPNFPRKICDKCLNRTISAYLFTQQCEQSERALRNCFEDMYAKLEKLDPLDKTKKRGRHKLNPNYNVLYTDHEKVMDYAEPIRNIVNTKSVSLSDEKYMSDLECPKCWQLFTKVEDLIVHEKSHPSSMWFNCRLCGKSFVKRLQLKRHLKQAHSGPEIEVEENHLFQCGTCGFSCDDHSVYLQHIEKHKFQSVLEHVVEKKMDKLCTVCLDKRPKLTELDKMVRLHGGYPGVTGDKSLYSILGSTLPDRKSYKYQELYVPHHANIMKFAKLTKEKPQNESLYNCGSNMNQIIISNPVVISNDKFDCEEMFLFFFSDPSYNKDNGTEIYFVNKNRASDTVTQGIKYPEQNASTLSAMMSKENKSNSIEIHEEKCAMVEMDATMHNVNNTLNIQNVDENVELNVSENKNIEKTTSVNETPCKTCWIFKKPTCKTCIGNQINIDEKADNGEINDASNDTKGICKYCWLFKTTDKCGVCKNSTYSNITTNTNILGDQSTIKLESTNAELQRKRKQPDDGSKLKNKKWDCHICLTTNLEERLTCICCEFNRNNQKDVLKVNLYCKHPFKMLKFDEAPSLNDTTTQNVSTLLDKERQQDVNLIISNTEHMPMDTMHFEKPHTPSIADTSKTFELTKSMDAPEEMDIAEEDNTQMMTPNLNPFSFNIAYSSNIITQSTDIKAELNDITPQMNNLEQSSNILVSNSQINFNIGTGSSKKITGTSGRRMARPIRRIAYHK